MSAAFSQTALSLVPRRSLRDHIQGVDLILEALDQLDVDGISEERRIELGEDLIAGIAGTKAKVDDTNRVLAMLEALADAAKKEIGRLTARATRYDRQHQRLTDYVLATMEASKLPVMEGFTSTLKAQKNPAKVVIDDVSAIPRDFLRYSAPPPPEPDKDKIKGVLKTRGEVPGCRLVQTSRLVRS